MKKIRGPLLLFIIILGVIAPITYFLLLLQSNGSDLDLLRGLGLVALLVCTGFFLYDRKSYGLPFAKIFLVSQILYLSFKGLLLYRAEFFGSLTLFVIALVFIYQSKDVQEIYGNIKPQTSGFSIWAIMAVFLALLTPFHAAIFAVFGISQTKQHPRLQGRGLAIVALTVSVVMLLISGSIGINQGDFFGVNEPRIHEIDLFGGEPLSCAQICGEYTNTILRETHYPGESLCECLRDGKIVGIGYVGKY